MSQSFNFDSILSLPVVYFFQKSLAIPHLAVRSINDLNPKFLRDIGFKGIIFDKDNTLTNPYESSFHPSIVNSINTFKSEFPESLAIFSNSAGTLDDKAGREAVIIENNLGIPVIRHKRKKPNGIQDVLTHFNCEAHELVVIGDRAFTDIVFGNKNGLFTILTQQFTSEGDNPFAQFAYQIEKNIIARWRSSGLTPPKQLLLGTSTFDVDTKKQLITTVKSD